MFKVGDLVKGTEFGECLICNEYMTKAEVTEVYGDGYVEIIVLEHEYSLDYEEGQFHTVDARKLDLFSSVSTGMPVKKVATSTVVAPKNDYELLVVLGEL